MRRILTLAASAALVVACGPNVDASDAPVFQASASAQTPAKEPSAQAPNSAHIPVTQRPVQSRDGDVSVSTVLYSDQDADVAARIDGVVQEISVELGDALAEGQVLARLEDGREVARVAAATAALDRAKSEHARAVELRKAAVITDAEFEDAVFSVRLAESALQGAEVELGYTLIRAPFAGVVTRRITGKGRAVTAGAAMFRVTALEPLRALLHVTEQEARSIRRGEMVILTGAGGVQVSGTVARMSPAVDPQAGTVELLVNVARPGVLRPGSAVTARLARASGQRP